MLFVYVSPEARSPQGRPIICFPMRIDQSLDSRFILVKHAILGLLALGRHPTQSSAGSASARASLLDKILAGARALKLKPVAPH